MGNRMDLAKRLLEEAMEERDSIVKDRRFLHEHAEVGFELDETVAFVKRRLRECGLESEKVGKAGLTASLGKEGKVLLLRADMDALPMKEEADISFACKTGRMHACGHDMHTAMLLGAARLLKKHEKELAGRVKLVFQPAEEILEGAKDMVEAGVLEHPKVNGGMMLHVMAGMPFLPGTAIVSAPGVSAPGADYFTIEVQGKGCHGSMPNAGVDPLTIAAHILIALQEIQARELALMDRAILTIGSIHGGSVGNVIPDKAVMEGALRTYDENVRSSMKTRIEEIAVGLAHAFRGEVKVTWGSGCPSLYNDKEMCDRIGSYLLELLGKERFYTVEELQKMTTDSSSKSAGSEDFAYISRLVPSVMIALAAGQPEKGYSYPLHHPKVCFDEETLAYGSAIFAYSAIRWLQDRNEKDV